MPLVIQIQSKLLLLVCHPKMLSNLIRIASNNWIRTHTASYWGHNDYHWNTTKILATYLIQSIGRVLCCWCSGLSRCPKQTCPGFILTLLATRNSIKKKAQNVHILISFQMEAEDFFNFERGIEKINWTKNKVNLLNLIWVRRLRLVGADLIACYLGSVWSDLAKFHLFGKYLKIFGKLFKVYLVLGNVFNSLGHTLYAFVQIFNAVNDQILKAQSGHLVTLLGLHLMSRKRMDTDLGRKRHIKGFHGNFYAQAKGMVHLIEYAFMGIP